MKKICLICGQEFQTIPNGGSRKYCFTCVPHGLSLQERTNCKRQAAKQEAVKRLGGCCAKCGEKRPHVLSFHHINPNEKISNPSTLLADSKIEEFFLEIQKCVLLCNNCHADYHFLEANNHITLDEYLNTNIDYQPPKNELPELSRLQEIQLQQDKQKQQVTRHVYQGKVIAYNDN